MTASRYVTLDEAALREAAQSAVDHARALGADGASAWASAGGGVKVVVREGVAETALRDGYRSLDVTVFRDGRTGSASTTTLDGEAIRRAVQEAATIASRVQPDADAGLADPGTLAKDGPLPTLFAPDARDADALIHAALAIETAALARPLAPGVSARVTEAGAVSSDALSALATSAGFCRSSASSHHGRWCMVLAQGADSAVQDYDEVQDRRPDALDDPAAIAARAVARATARLGARPVPSRRGPVLFAPRVATALVHQLVTALSGGPQYRGASFLPEALGRQVLADDLDLNEDPFEPFGLASAGFDAEGVAGTKRQVIAGGVVQGYFLGSVAARRLGLRSTGNAGGPYNLRLTSRRAGGDAAAMRARLGTGLLVTELLGGAVDPVRGTWTHAVAGFWIEDGAIVHPVQDVTVGGAMRAMLRAILAVGDDVERRGAIRTGSILIDDMQVGGRG